MERHLNLVKNDGTQQEKRVFPRYPYCYLTFKGKNVSLDKVFEVKNISYTGMQLGLKNGDHPYKKGDGILGDLHWLGKALTIKGLVRWFTPNTLGVSFETEKILMENVKHFLSVKNMVKGLRPLHRREFGLDLPTNLSYWLRADGPIEIFIWQHVHGEFSKFQVILLNHFVEWEDGKGTRTGTCLSQREIETPLIDEGEYVFEFDSHLNKEKIENTFEMISAIPDDLLPKDIAQFLYLKLDQ